MKARLITVLLVVFMVAGMLQGCTAIVSQAGAQPGSVQVVPDSAELAAESKAIDDANKAAYAEKLLNMEDEVDVQNLRNAWEHIPYAEAVAWADVVAQKYGVESADVQAIIAAAPEAQLEAYQRRYEVEMQKLRDAHKDMTYSEAVAMGDALGYMYEVAPVEGAVNAASEALAAAATSAQRAALETAAERQDLIEAQKGNEFMLHDAIEKAAASYPSAGQGDQIEAANIRLEQEIQNAQQLYRAGERLSYED